MNYIKDMQIDSIQSNAIKHKNKIALGFNIAILAMVILAIAAMFSGLHPSKYPIDFKNASGFPGVFSKPYTQYFAYFSLIINMIAAVASCINITYLILIKKRKITVIPKWLHLINLVITTSLVFNFFFTLLYMMPVVQLNNVYYFMFLVTGSNLLFNVFVPLAFVLQFIFCFKDYKIKLVENVYSLIPLLVYSIVYGAIALTHIQNGKIMSQYDLYLFGNHYFWLIFVAFVISMAACFGIAVGINKCNQISQFNRIKFILVINLFIIIVIPIMTGFMFYHNATVEYIQEGLTPIQTVGIRFTYFTHWSNWLTGIACIIQSVYIFRVIKGKAKVIPTWVQVVKLAAVALITVTMVTQFVVAGSKIISASDLQTGIDNAYKKCFYYHLIFEHFINPLFVLLSFALLENSKIKFKNLFYAAIPFGFYALMYAIVLYCHVGDTLLPSPKVTTWDVYRVSALFGKVGPYIYWILPAIAYVAIFGVNWIIWLVNRKVRFTHVKSEPVFVEFKKWKNQRILTKKKIVRVVPVKSQTTVKKTTIVKKHEHKSIKLSVAGTAILIGLPIFMGLLSIIIALALK